MHLQLFIETGDVMIILPIMITLPLNQDLSAANTHNIQEQIRNNWLWCTDYGIMDASAPVSKYTPQFYVTDLQDLEQPDASPTQMNLLRAHLSLWDCSWCCWRSCFPLFLDRTHPPEMSILSAHKAGDCLSAILCIWPVLPQLKHLFVFVCCGGIFSSIKLLKLAEASNS